LDRGHTYARQSIVEFLVSVDPSVYTSRDRRAAFSSHASIGDFQDKDRSWGRVYLSWIARLRGLTERYRIAAFRTAFVIAVALVILGWQINQVQDDIVKSGVLVLILLGVTIESLAAFERAQQAEKTFIVNRDDEEFNQAIRARLADIPRCRKVDMLEYSGHSVHFLLESLVKNGASVRLLIRDPTSVNQFQSQRIMATIRHIERFVLIHKPGKIEIRTYAFASSLRGRRFDNTLVVLGWYTPDVEAAGIAGDMEVMGHCNPTVIAASDSQEGQALVEFFDRTFSALWASGQKLEVSLPD
jgi:hypothetical protein